MESVSRETVGLQEWFMKTTRERIQLDKQNNSRISCLVRVLLSHVISFLRDFLFASVSHSMKYPC